MRPLLLAIALATLTACSSFSFPYRIDVEQGNVVDQEMVDQLRPGMSRNQVRYIMGSPMIEDPFHPERWDYIYRLNPSHGETQQRRVTLIFDGDRLARLQGDIRPGAPQRPAEDSEPADEG
jgi:outer membrane protein assembly factor BamE